MRSTLTAMPPATAASPIGSSSADADHGVERALAWLVGDRRPVARVSQFQPPSGHCQSTSDRASSSARGSSAMPRRQATASALPSWEAQRRASPPITFTLRRCDGQLVQYGRGGGEKAWLAGRGGQLHRRYQPPGPLGLERAGPRVPTRPGAQLRGPPKPPPLRHLLSLRVNRQHQTGRRRKGTVFGGRELGERSVRFCCYRLGASRGFGPPGLTGAPSGLPARSQARRQRTSPTLAIASDPPGSAGAARSATRRRAAVAGAAAMRLAERRKPGGPVVGGCHGLRARTTPFAPGASNHTVSTSTNPVSRSHVPYSAGV